MWNFKNGFHVSCVRGTQVLRDVYVLAYLHMCAKNTFTYGHKFIGNRFVDVD